VQADHFTERLGAVRTRFASSLGGRASDAHAGMPVEPAVNVHEAAAVSSRCFQETYRNMRALGLPEDGRTGACRRDRGRAAGRMASLERVLGARNAAAREGLPAIAGSLRGQA
jgi:hypothetical protein